jgi:hypothetical protein
VEKKFSMVFYVTPKINGFNLSILEELQYLPEIAITLLIDKSIYNNKVLSYKYYLWRLFYKKYLKKMTLLRETEIQVTGENTVLIGSKQLIFANVIQLNKSEELKEFTTDAIFQATECRLPEWIYTQTKYGVWKIHLSDSRYNIGNSEAFWEVINHKHTTGVELLKTSLADEESEIISRIVIKTRKSLKNNYNAACNAAKPLARIIVEKISLYGEGYLKSAKNRYLCVKETKDKDIPSNIILFFGLAGYFIRKFWQCLFPNRFKEQWLIFFNFTDCKVSNIDLKNFIEIRPPKDKFWADPFVVCENEKYFIFFEEYLYNIQKAHLSVLEIDKEGNYSRPEIILETPYHLSYPFILKVDGKYYMMPESSENHTIDLYECASFPNKWKHIHTLMDNIDAGDTTLIFRDNKWWLFTNIKDDYTNDRAVNLCIFYASDLFLGKWTPHPQNPVITDISKARMAGHIFEEGGKLYRPSQDCSVNYGGAININLIHILNTEVYEEINEMTFLPDFKKGLLGIHQFDRCDDLIVIDGCYKYK